MSNKKPDENPNNIPNEKKYDNSFFSVLISYYCHQNQLMWNRVQIFLTIQTGVIGGAYLLKKDSILQAFLLLIGAIISYLIQIMFKRDEQIRDGNNNLITKLGKQLSSQYTDDENEYFKLGMETKHRFLPKASGLYQTVLWITIFSEIGAFFYILFIYFFYLIKT